MNWSKDEFWISDQRSDVDVPAVHKLLSVTYWASSRPKERTEQGIRQSMCFSLKQRGEQIGFARVLLDGGCYAIVVDVVVGPQFQGKGLGRWMLSVIASHPDLAGAVLILWTTDKVGFYEACGLKHETGFKLMRRIPEWMERGPK
jgi:GNAT superfamily N-acetyltransferase